MMRNLHLWGLVLLILCTGQATFGQETEKRDTGINIVPNPSFEKLLPEKSRDAMEPFMVFRKRMQDWTSPTSTTPDLIEYINSPDYETARTGDLMVGVLTHNPISKKSDTWREYVQVRLDLELEYDEEYLVEFWVMRHPQSTVASNNMGALLSRVPISTNDYQPITHLDLAVNETEIINPDMPQWQKISTVFTARGDERFLILGNFFDNENTKFQKVKNNAFPAWENPYYLIDDVSIRHLTEPGLASMEVKKGDVIKLDKIYFESNRWNLLEDSYTQMEQLVKLMRKHPFMKIAINGYTDSRGSEQYNLTISENRCKAVYQYLIDQSIHPTRLQYQGHGEAYPVDTNDTEEGRSNNRRVEFVILQVERMRKSKKVIEVEVSDAEAGQ